MSRVSDKVDLITFYDLHSVVNSWRKWNQTNCLVSFSLNGVTSLWQGSTNDILWLHHVSIQYFLFWMRVRPQNFRSTIHCRVMEATASVVSWSSLTLRRLLVPVWSRTARGWVPSCHAEDSTDLAGPTYIRFANVSTCSVSWYCQHIYTGRCWTTWYSACADCLSHYE